MPNSGSGNPYFQIAPVGTSISLSGGTPFSRTGYTLNSWNTKEDGSGKKYSLSENIILTASETLYAQWTINTCIINFDPNEGSGNIPPIIVPYGTEITIPGSHGIRKNDHEFVNWNTEKNGNGVTYTPGETIILTKSFTLYAQWKNNYAIDLDQTLAYSYRLIEGFVNYFMEYENENNNINNIDNEYSIFLLESLTSPEENTYHEFNLILLLLSEGYLDWSKYIE